MGEFEGRILYRKEALAGKGGVEELTTLDQRLIFPPWLAMDMHTQNEGSTKNPRQRDHRRAQSPEDVLSSAGALPSVIRDAQTNRSI